MGSLGGLKPINLNYTNEVETGNSLAEIICLIS